MSSASKISAHRIVERLKEKDEDAKANVSFRLTKDVVSEFKRICKRQGVLGSHVVEEFMSDFIEAFKRDRGT